MRDEIIPKTRASFRRVSRRETRKNDDENPYLGRGGVGEKRKTRPVVAETPPPPPLPPTPTTRRRCSVASTNGDSALRHRDDTHTHTRVYNITTALLAAAAVPLSVSYVSVAPWVRPLGGAVQAPARSLVIETVRATVVRHGPVCARRRHSRS